MHIAAPHARTGFFRLAGLVPVVFALFLVSGCSSLSVSHLESRPLATAAPATVSMKFWRFEFSGAAERGGYAVRGRATPVTTDLPPWVDRLEELTLFVYLRDAAGNVLASGERHFGGMALGPGAVIPFECHLAPDAAAPGGYAVSFGYKAAYGSQTARTALAAKGPPPAGAVFFAGEGAVRKH